MASMTNAVRGMPFSPLDHDRLRRHFSVTVAALHRAFRLVSRHWDRLFYPQPIRISATGERSPLGRPILEVRLGRQRFYCTTQELDALLLRIHRDEFGYRFDAAGRFIGFAK